jgi:aryl carrier-like protein
MEELDDDIDVSRVRQILAEIGHELPVAADRADQRLAAYYVSATGVGTAELRAHLTALLPEYMVPTYLVPLPEIPLTVNGKFDRKALPDPGVGRPELASAYVAPSTETEHQLAAIWRDMLRLPEVGVHDNFFDLGGDSVTSVRVAAAARRLGMALTARDVFAHHTIAELAQVIDGAAPSDERGGATDAPWESRVGPQDAARIVAQLGATASSIEDVYPLTPTQAGMLYHYLRSPDTATYFGQGTCTFAGPVDGGRLAEAWRLVCDRHQGATPVVAARHAGPGRPGRPAAGLAGARLAGPLRRTGARRPRRAPRGPTGGRFRPRRRRAAHELLPGARARREPLRLEQPSRGSRRLVGPPGVPRGVGDLRVAGRR